MSEFTFSENTLSVLKNFQTINQNIMFTVGKVIKTIAPAKNIYAEYESDEEFTKDFAIYDLSKLLSVLNLFEENPNIVFGENALNISSDGKKYQYFYASPETLILPPQKGLKLPQNLFTFDLSKNILKKILSASAVGDLEDFKIFTKDNNVFLSVFNEKDDTSGNFEVDLGKSTVDANFEFIFKINNFKMLPGDYVVSLAEKAALFQNNQLKLKYFIALEPNSTFTKKE